jgi:hypothetical protein
MKVEDKVRADIIRKKSYFDAAFEAVLVILAGIAAPWANPHISLGASVIIAVVTAYILVATIRRTHGRLHPLNAKRAFQVGFVWGAIAGIGIGITLGWAGGVGDVGVWPWVLGLSIFWGIGSGLANLYFIRSLSE